MSASFSINNNHLLVISLAQEKEQTRFHTVSCWNMMQWRLEGGDKTCQSAFALSGPFAATAVALCTCPQGKVSAVLVAAFTKPKL